MRRLVLAAVCAVVATEILIAQSGSAPAFDVASIKPAPLNATMTRQGSALPGGRWSAANATLEMILRRAYPDYGFPGLIVGGPGWVREQRFDIEAKSDADPSRDELLRMVRQLLADRFSLKVHEETRPIDIYALIVARPDGRLGARMRPATPACVAEVEQARARAKAATGQTVLSSNDPQPCNSNMRMAATGVVRITGGWSISPLLAAMQTWMDKRVIDRTGLDGIYEMDLEFDFGTIRSAGAADSSDTPGLSIFTAVQEQLGLKLEPRREPLAVLVIDSVERPTAN